MMRIHVDDTWVVSGYVGAATIDLRVTSRYDGPCLTFDDQEALTAFTLACIDACGDDPRIGRMQALHEILTRAVADLEDGERRESVLAELRGALDEYAMPPSEWSRLGDTDVV